MAGFHVHQPPAFSPFGRSKPALPTGARSLTAASTSAISFWLPFARPQRASGNGPSDTIAMVERQSGRSRAATKHATCVRYSKSTRLR